ncbi:flagellar associated protein [Cystoisospora suis]|uniref:Cilia- and flagella-associated protein 263 n=1 Tax=Cystoisospora suis TaxID=483139 RepID=A0A2C6KS81_9APIC|nr:flagellar associated protein [Cystoisospora suis]
MAEKVLKWIEDRLARKDLQITKLKLRAHHLRQQARAPARRLKSRMESGDDLHYIDFHQLQIENEQFAAKIEEANREVLRQKSICAKTLQSQMQMKQTLQMCVEEAKRLQTQIDERKVLLRKAKIDVQKAVREKDAARNDNKRLHIQSRATLKVPQTLDYVNSRAEEYSLQQQVKTWRRKVEVAELELKRLRARKKDKAKPAE